MAQKIKSVNTITKQQVEGTHEEGTLESTGQRAQQIEIEPVRVEKDEGVGEAVILRHFFFKATPAPFKPTQAQLLSENKRLIEATLWGDGLEPIPEKRVEIHTRQYLKKISKTLYTKMTHEKADFVIMVMARAKRGVFLNERPQTI